MATVSFKGNPIHTCGDLPAVGSKAPAFTLVNQTLQDVSLADFSGRRKLLNVFPSLDTSVCAKSIRTFHEFAKGHVGPAYLMISADLPFAQARFATTEGLAHVTMLSMMRDRQFARDYGVLLVDGPLAGLAARAVFVLDEQDVVLYTELVAEIGHEPDYDTALRALAS